MLGEDTSAICCAGRNYIAAGQELGAPVIAETVSSI